MGNEVKVSIKISVLPYGSFVFTETLGSLEQPRELKEEKITSPPYVFPQSTGPELFSHPLEVKLLA